VALKLWQLPSVKKTRDGVIKELNSEVVILQTLPSDIAPAVYRWVSSQKLPFNLKDEYAFLVMELCDDNLAEFVVNKKCSKRTMLSITKQLLRAYDYCHSHNIVHRDVKPVRVLFSNDFIIFVSDISWPQENVLVASQEREDGCPWIKLCDFAISKVLPRSQHSMYTQINPYSDDLQKRWWQPPEVVAADVQARKSYNKLADVWGVGCLVYFVATGGGQLFRSKEEALLSKDEANRATYLQRNNLHVEHPLIHDLVQRLTYHEPNERLDLKEALTHPALWSGNAIITHLRDLYEATNKENATSTEEVAEVRPFSRPHL
jgi:serine/threonine protein kinase